MHKAATSSGIAIAILALLGIGAVIYFGIATPIIDAIGANSTGTLNATQVTFAIIYIILSIVAILVLIWVFAVFGLGLTAAGILHR